MKNSQENSSPLSITLKKTIFKHIFFLIRHSNIQLVFATILFLIHEIQIIALLSIPTTDLTTIPEPEFLSLISVLRVFILELPISSDVKDEISLGIILVLVMLEIMLMLIIMIEIKKEEISGILTKIVTVFSFVLPIPIATTCAFGVLNTSELNGPIIFLSIVLFILFLLTHLTLEMFHYQFSLQAIQRSVLVRKNKKFLSQLFLLILPAFYPIAISQNYPIIFIIFMMIYLIVKLVFVVECCIGINYLSDKLTKNIGRISLLSITWILGELMCYTNVTLFKENLYIFIISLYSFLFWLIEVFWKYKLKRIIIDSDIKDEISQFRYIVTYMNFYIQISHKKNESYISSLLKNHINNCSETECCCKNRNSLYDPSTSTHGNQNVQPHLDPVFIKHFFLKIITNSILEFPRSILLKFLLAYFYLEILDLPYSCVKMLKTLSRRSIGDKMTVAESYLLYCFEQQIYEKIVRNNIEKGDHTIEKAKQFDEGVEELNNEIDRIIGEFSAFWDFLSYRKISPKNLIPICSNILSIMFSIEEKYAELKKINSVSSELMDMMVVYSKQVIHDIHFLSEIKKELKVQQLTINIQKKSELTINIFSQDSINMVCYETNRIKWASRNAFQIFGYPRYDDFIRLKITELMPAYFGNNHEAHVKKWMETGKSTKVNKQVMIWGHTKENEIFRCKMFLKIMPIGIQKDIQMYVCFQKLPQENEIICGPNGQIYGCDKKFADLLKCPLGIIEATRPNIQILFPGLFPYFFHYFFKDGKEKHRNEKQQEIDHAGYIPEGIVQFFTKEQKQRDIFLKGNENNKGFKNMFSLFLEERMQKVTEGIDGRYVRIHFQLQYRTICQQQVCVFQIFQIRYNAIDYYYNELEQTLERLTSEREVLKEQGKGKLKYQQFHQKVDYFQLFINPVKIKQALMNEQILATSFKDRSPPNINFRRKLALFSQEEIKNEKVRNNIFKIKKVLLKNGIITHHCFRILTHSIKIDPPTETAIKSAHPETQQKINENGSDSEDGLKNHNEQISEEDMKSFQESATSSAAFISLTNHIKNFKLKLRSMNAPKILTILHYLIIIYGFAMIGSFVLNYNIQINYILEQKEKFMEKGETFHIINNLLSCRMINSFILQNSNSTYTSENQAFTSYFLTDSHDILTRQIEKRAVAEELLAYLEETISVSDESITNIQEFILKEIRENQIKVSRVNFQDYRLVLQKIDHFWETNYLQKSLTMQMYYRIISCFICILLLLGTIFVFRQLEIKICEIIGLLEKISPNEKEKYWKNFRDLQDRFNEKASAKSLVFVTKKKLNPEIKAKRKSNEQKQKHKSEYSNIIILFLFLIVGILSCYLAFHMFFTTLITAQDTYQNILTGKMELSQRLLTLITLQSADLAVAEEAKVIERNAEMNIVEEIYSIYHSPLTDNSTKNYILSMVQNNTCSQVGFEIDLCQTINRNTYTRGVINSYHYLHEKIHHLLYLATVQTTEKERLIVLSNFNSLFTYNLLNQLIVQEGLNLMAASEKQFFYMIACGVVMLLFILLWWRKERKIAKWISSINAFFLLIPFDILSENPYIKLYIKQEFNFKSASY